MGVELVEVEQELIDLVYVEFLLQQIIQPGLQNRDGLLCGGDFIVST